MSSAIAGHVHTNALIRETSPYLLQHAHNPVDWYPWGDEALEKARREDKPIFLSIGYSACHWCHVMERESFENEQIAEYLNEHFVSIKVDREERPDLDDIYMAAVVALNGHGGWPMTVFLTPGLQPFYGGTYYPPNDRHGQPGFYRLLHGIQDAWKNRRAEVVQNAEGLAGHVTAQLSAMAPAGSREPEYVPLLESAVRDLERQFDHIWGGWGGAPKFPSGMGIGLLLREFKRTGNRETLQMATHTLDRMAAGGIYDHLGGGFARYSVDGEWQVPHFEKMLYDNAQLAHAYLEAYQATGHPRYAQVARETLDYVLRDMLDEAGAFHSAEDADSEGEEGKFYLWHKGEIVKVLGDDDASLFCRYYGIHEMGNFQSHEHYHHHQNILYLAQDPSQTARQVGLTIEQLERQMTPLRQKLFEHRSGRVRPGKDDKILTSWNGLMISAVCLGGRVLREPRYCDAAVAAGQFFRERMWQDGALLRTHRRGESRLPGYLDDHAFLANAYVDLYEATFDVAWLREAERIAEVMIERFFDEETGTFFFTAAEHKHLIVRTRPSHDGAEPSGSSVAALLLLRLAALQGRDDYEAMARKVVAACAPMVAHAPRGYLKLLWAIHWLADPPKEIAIVVRGASAGPMVGAVDSMFLPNKVLACGDGKLGGVGLLEGKTAPEHSVLAYVCRNRACDRPVSTPEELISALA